MKDKDCGVMKIKVYSPKYAVSCLICGKTIGVYDYRISPIQVCEDCKKAIAYAKKLMEKENEEYLRKRANRDYIKLIKKQASKETAERDFNHIIKALEIKKASIITHYGVKESVGADVAIRTVKELAKQFGAEIKE